MRRRVLLAVVLATLSWATVPGLSAGATLAGPGHASTPAPALAAPRSAAPDVSFVRQRPCPDGSEFTCVTLRVPRDHFAPFGPGSPTFTVTFAIHRASSGDAIGTFVTVTGGPGTSGIAAADPYTALFDPGIVDRYDIVFFDQRGIGQSEPLQCPNAALAFYDSPHVPTISAAQARAFAADSRTFARDCIAETGVDPAELPYFSTAQAVEDLEDIRAWLGASQIDLYGESYGTQFVQTYAAAHPSRLHSLMLDGPVDLTLTGTQYYAEDVRAFQTALVNTLETCTATRACRRDVSGGDALAGYDQLAARLHHGPVAFTFIDAHGRAERRTFDLGDLETAAAGYVYGEYDRMTLERAIAWATRGRLLPLARLTYISLGEDPETQTAIPDPTDSDAMYYAVECMDYAYGTGSAGHRAQAYLAAGVAADVDDVRLGSVFYGDLPCAYWPVHPAPGRPAYLTNEPFPTFVMTSTWDPATPYAGALRIDQHLTDAYLIVQPGGPHVIFGRGNACPDDLITAFLLDGTRPAARRTDCDFTGVDPYVRIPAGSVAAYHSALGAMTAMDDEINNSADYAAWDGTGQLRYGCLGGGWIRYTPYDDGYRVTLHACQLTPGFALTGKATIDTTDGTFSLAVHGPPGTNLVYHRDADGNRTVSGTFRGHPAH